MRQAIGIDIGGTSLRAAKVAEDGSLAGFRHLPTPARSEDVLEALDLFIAALDPGGGLPVGLGVPARVNARQGTAAAGGYVDLSGPPIATRLAHAKGRRVRIENDASMALLAEARRGVARDTSDVVMLTIGTGIGGAVLSEGRLLHGHAAAGQLGHLTVNMNGAPCRCGRRGCIETTSSGKALDALLREAGLPERIDAAILLKPDDPRMAGIVAKWAGPLRFAIDSLAAAFDPALIVLGGALGATAAAALQRFPSPSRWFEVPLAAAALGADAGVIGAGLAALETDP